MFFYKVVAASLALLAPLVSALTIEQPTDWNSGGSVTITWTAQAGDPQTFTVELANPSFNRQFALANNVPTGQMSLTLTLPIVPEGDGYMLQFVQNGDINTVFTQTSSFSVGATVSSSASSSSSSSGSASSTGSASASLLSSSASASASATATSASATRSNVASTSGSGSSSAASSSASTFNSGAAAISVSRSNLAGFAVMAGAALAGARLVGF